MGNVTDNLSEAGSHIKQAAAHAGDSLKGAAAAASAPSVSPRRWSQ